jgi:adenosine deaminase
VKSGVPVVLAGDDPGMMRTTQTQEFYLAAERYPSITYSDLKRFAENSIKYSFLAPGTKEQMMTALREKFQIFEEKWKERILLKPGLDQH